MSSQPDPPIIISGGSVTIKIPGGIFSGLLGGALMNFTNAQKEIKRVAISGSGLPGYDETATNSDITITIEYGNP
jgi:hypothetical protein